MIEFVFFDGKKLVSVCNGRLVNHYTCIHVIALHNYSRALLFQDKSYVTTQPQRLTVL